MIEADAPNNYQQIVTFSDGERLLVNNSDLADLNDAIVSKSSKRTYPKEYSEVIKSDYWAELSTQEAGLITALQNASSQPDTIGLGSIVAHADPYRTLYVEKGEVLAFLAKQP